VLEEKEKYILSKYMKTTAITTTTTTTTTTATVNNNTTSTTTTTTSLMSSLSNTRSTSPYSQSQESSNTQRRSYSPTNSNSDDSNSGDSSAGDSSVGDSSTGESSTGGRSSTGYGSVGESIDSEKTLRNSDDKKGNLSKNNVLKGSKMERKSHEPPQKYVHYQPIEDGIYSLTMTNDYMTLEYAEEFGQAITKLSQLKKMKALIIEYEDQLSKGLEPSLKEELNKTKPSKTKINEIYKIYFHCMKLANVNVPVICCLNGEITDLNILLAILSNWRLITRRSYLSSHNNPININWITELVNAKNDTQSLNLIEKIEKEKISAIQAYKLKYVNDIASNAENMKKMALEMAKSIIQNDEENPINITIEDVEKINNAIKI
jgi:enoyl-CoA hydratase/carnithine racemase